MTELKRTPLEVGWSSALMIPKLPKERYPERGRLLILKSPMRPAPGRPWPPSPHPSTSPASYIPISPTCSSFCTSHFLSSTPPPPCPQTPQPICLM